MEETKIQSQESGACKPGIWGLECRNWILEPSFLCLDESSGSWTLELDRDPPSSGPLILDSELSALDRGSLIVDFEQWILDLDIQFWILDSGPRHPVLDLAV